MRGSQARRPGKRARIARRIERNLLFIDLN
jgi:hypothetical protein